MTPERFEAIRLTIGRGHQMIDELIEEVENLRNRVVIHEDTIVQQREALLTIQKERDHARKTAVALWCSEGLPVELWPTVREWIPKGTCTFCGGPDDGHEGDGPAICMSCWTSGKGNDDGGGE